MKRIIIVLILVILISGVIIFIQKSSQQKDTKNPSATMDKVLQSDNNEAVKKAKEIFQQKKAAGVDMSSGPCLSNKLLPDWVADVAHNPRQSVDDLPQNQCNAFATGTAHHFIELDTEGNLIRIY